MKKYRSFALALTLSSLFAVPAAHASCSASTQCSNGTSLTCSGSGSASTCSSDPSWVECDGVRQNCPVPPACTATVTCRDGSTVSCQSYQSFDACIAASPLWVQCDGVYNFCPECSNEDGTGRICPTID